MFAEASTSRHSGVVDVRLTDDPSVFADLASDFTRADPFSTNVIGVYASSRISGVRPKGPEDLWAVVVDAGGPVYTPPAHRRHGYAAAVTANATATALEKGAAQVVLYTDVDNPTSNSVYMSIGYVADHDATERRFVHRGNGSAD
jgi:RimJ/RimL family protein N-acetyltransferase